MDTRQVRLKKELCESICSLLQSFVEETGVIIDRVDVESQELMQGYVCPEDLSEPLVQIFYVDIRCKL